MSDNIATLFALLEEEKSHIIARTASTFDDLTRSFGHNFVLIGAGRLGLRTLAGLQKIGIKPLAIVDTNEKLWNMRVGDHTIMPPAEAVAKHGKSAVFIATIWNPDIGHPLKHLNAQFSQFGRVKIVSFAFLYWKYPDIFLPHFCIDEPYKTKEESAQILHCYSLWQDNASQSEFISQVRWRLWHDFDQLTSPVDSLQYFPDDLFSLSSEEIFIDCGAFIGDTISDFLRATGGSFGHIFAFEPDTRNFEALREHLAGFPDSAKRKISLHKTAVGKFTGTVSFEEDATFQSAVSTNGTSTVNIVALDDFLSSVPSFIKMDVEGHEPEALAGAKMLIEHHSPILAISVYHKYNHLWQLPLYMRSLSDNYRFFLRAHRAAAWDLVCYAVPIDRLDHNIGT